MAAVPLLFGPQVAAQTDPPGWTSHDMSTTTVKAFTVAPADVDGDGDLDAFSAGFNDTIAWQENVEGPGLVWVDHFIDIATFAFSSHAADVNGDGDVDLVVGSASTTEPLIWYENRFGDGSGWIRHVVTRDSFTARDVHAADVDADGDIDLLTASESTDVVTLWLNQDGSGTDWTSVAVGTGDSALYVEVADMDDNGTLDVLTIYSQETRVAWYSNTAGDGSEWVEHDILFSAGVGGHCVSPGDIDGDGDMDAISANFSNYLLAYHENANGLGTDWVNTSIPTTIGKFISVYTADIDSDGDIDAVTSSFDQSVMDATPIAWQENLLGDGSSWAEHPISGVAAKGRTAVVADVDGDCDPDVLAATSTNDRIAWFENLMPITDCNGNGIGDACDIATGTSIDCNKNGVPDECDLVIGNSGDGLSFGIGGIEVKPVPWIGGPNGIPDECEFPILDRALLTLATDPGLAVRRAGLGRSGGVCSANEPLELVVEGGRAGADALLVASFTGSSTTRADGRPSFMGSSRIVLEAGGRTTTSLLLSRLPAGAGQGGIVSVRVVLLTPEGVPVSWSEALHVTLMLAP